MCDKCVQWLPNLNGSRKLMFMHRQGRAKAHSMCLSDWTDHIKRSSRLHRAILWAGQLPKDYIDKPEQLARAVWAQEHGLDSSYRPVLR